MKKTWISDFLWQKNKIEEKTLEKIEKIHLRENWIFSLYCYKEKIIKDMIWQIKYRADRKKADYFGHKMAEVIEKHNMTDYILVPIPIHCRRKLERGFNQSEWLCHSIKKFLQKKKINLSILKILKRRTYTKKQSWQDKKDRKKNIKSVFAFRKKFNKKIIGRKILIIDDIVTTGATLNEARDVLLQSGLKEIKALTIAF